MTFIEPGKWNIQSFNGNLFVEVNSLMLSGNRIARAGMNSILELLTTTLYTEYIHKLNLDSVKNTWIATDFPVSINTEDKTTSDFLRHNLRLTT